MKETVGMALVRRDCANLVANECLGVTVRGTLWRKVGKCLIAEGEECEYYNKCLHPLIEKRKVRKRWSR
jgi:hypothetical protein